MTGRREFLIALLSIAASCAALAEELTVKQKFIADLQNAVRNDDINWLAERMRFPVRYFGREATMIQNKKEFARNYRTFVSPKVRAAVLSLEPSKMLENWQGLMIGSGSYNIWIRNTAEGPDERYQILTINDTE